MELNALCDYYRLYPEDHPVLIGGAAASLWLSKKYENYPIYDYDIDLFTSLLPDPKDKDGWPEDKLDLIVQRWLALLPGYKIGKIQTGKNGTKSNIKLIAPFESRDIDLSIKQWKDEELGNIEHLEFMKLKIPILKLSVLIGIYENHIPKIEKELKVKYERNKVRLEMLKLL